MREAGVGVAALGSPGDNAESDGGPEDLQIVVIGLVLEACGTDLVQTAELVEVFCCRAGGGPARDEAGIVFISGSARSAENAKLEAKREL